MAGTIDKGHISQILPAKDWNGLSTQAIVDPCTNAGALTAPLTIPWYLRGKMGGLKIGDCVAYAVFDDTTGVIIDRLDGEWTGIIDYPTTTTGDVVHEKNVQTDGSQTTKGKTTTADLTTGSVGSYNGHVHTCPDGTTSGPR